jgi:hypothetical protein
MSDRLHGEGRFVSCNAAHDINVPCHIAVAAAGVVNPVALPNWAIHVTRFGTVPNCAFLSN